jgi:hypothetical protein
MNCPEPGCTVIGYCRFHAKLNPVVKEKKVYKIPARSKKRVKEQKVYVEIVKDLLDKDNSCKIGAPGCTKIASGLHHLQKRSPKNWLEKSNLIPACTSCNGWLESNSKEGVRMGFVKSKFK